MTQSSFCFINLGTDCGTLEMESKLGEEVDSSGSDWLGYDKEREKRKERGREGKARQRSKSHKWSKERKSNETKKEKRKKKKRKKRKGWIEM